MSNVSGYKQLKAQQTSKDLFPPKEKFMEFYNKSFMPEDRFDLSQLEEFVAFFNKAQRAYGSYNDWVDKEKGKDYDKRLKMHGFIQEMSKNVSNIGPYTGTELRVYIRNFVQRRTVCGAILVNETKKQVVLVRGYKRQSWFFPRRKKEENEEDYQCAQREIHEEIGLDISEELQRDKYIECKFGEQRVRLYVVCVKSDATFKRQDNKEIDEIKWFDIADLCPASTESKSYGRTGVEFYMVAPFLKGLMLWLSDST